jgi:hypothetical protein
MLDEASGVVGTDRRESCTYRFYQSLAAAGLRFPQDTFELGKSLLDGVEIWGVGWQVDELATSLLDQLPDPSHEGRSRCGYGQHILRSRLVQIGPARVPGLMLSFCVFLQIAIKEESRRADSNR